MLHKKASKEFLNNLHEMFVFVLVSVISSMSESVFQGLLFALAKLS